MIFHLLVRQFVHNLRLHFRLPTTNAKQLDLARRIVSQLRNACVIVQMTELISSSHELVLGGTCLRLILLLLLLGYQREQVFLAADKILMAEALAILGVS